MKIFKDYAARKIRLTDNRQAHILTRPELGGQEDKISETLLIS